MAKKSYNVISGAMKGLEAASMVAGVSGEAAIQFALASRVLIPQAVGETIAIELQDRLPMHEDLPLLPLGTSDFVPLRMRGQIYVDKTDLVFRLASQPEKFFLSRPRRFGKSLLVSTFESLFKFGLRDFKDLAIEKLWKDKAGYSVVRLDFSEIKQFTSIGQFERRLCSLLARGFGEVGFSFAPSEWFTVHDQLSVWMRKLPPNSLVVLIDEYDAPLTANLGNAALFEEVRGELSNFYATLKFNDRAIRFLFMTGITKFNKTSIFQNSTT